MKKHIKLFEEFVKDESEEHIDEASHPRRAWSGKIENIDKLLSWMYDKNILNKGEKAEKDSKFRQYYRFYNDNDFPAGLRSRGIHPGMKREVIESALEEYIEEFIKKVLAKYTGKFDRKDFHIDTILSDLNTLHSKTIEPDPYGLLEYWGKKINVNDSEFEKMLADLKPLYDDAKKAANDIVDKEIATGVYKDVKSWNIPGTSRALPYQRSELQHKNVWTPDAEKKYQKMENHMLKMGEILSNVIEATQRLKKETGV